MEKEEKVYREYIRPIQVGKGKRDMNGSIKR